MDFDKYNAGRRALVAEYKKKKYLNVLIVLLVGAALFVAVQFIGNIAVRAVLSAMIIMITVIFARVRAVTVEHALQTRLNFYEQEEPDFHANFRNDK